MKHIILSLIFIGVTHLVWAQNEKLEINGSIIDKSDGSGIAGATVIFVNIKDSTRSRGGITDAEGLFSITNLEQAFYRIRVRSVGYKAYTNIKRVVMSGDIGQIRLEPDTKMLNDVEIEGEIVAVEQIGDTTQYNAAAYKTNPDASAKDLVSKMPGIIVDSDGVSANGEDIEQVLVDGKRFFGQDPILSLNTIPAEVVDKIQVYDEESEQSKLTGFDDGNTTKTMNVVTKVDKRNGEFGKFYAGYGENDYYKAGAQVNSFKGDRRMTIIGMSNNINQQSFSSEDIADVGGGQRGGFRGQRNGNFMIGTQNGITKTNSVGMNFSNAWKDKLTLEGSYFFNKTDNTNNQVSSRETFLEDGSQYYDETENSNTENWNHRLNMRINYDINDNNKLILTPSFSYQNNEAVEYTIGATRDNEGDTLTQTDNTYTSHNKAYSFSNNLIYQHKFEKIGRTISFDMNTSFQPTDRKNLYEDYQADSLTEYLTDEGNYTIGSTVTYTEPIGGYSQLSVIYAINVNNRDSNKETYLLEEDESEKSFSEALSNKFESGYITHSPSVAFSTRKFGQFFNASLTYQHASLENNQTFPYDYDTDKSFKSLLPSLMGRLELSSTSDIFIRYSGSTSVPSVNQLQEVIDNSNPLFLSVGNASLEQSYTHSLMMRYGTRNTDKNTGFHNFIDVSTTNDYITTATTVLSSDSTLAEGITAEAGAQISSPVNISGYEYWNVRNNSTYTFTISPLKTNVHTTLGLSYARKPGITNNIKNISNTYSGNIRVNFASNISENTDFNIYYNLSANKVENSIKSSSNSQYMNQTAGGKLNLIFGDGFVFRNDISFQKYNGVSDSYNTEYTLWNMSVAKKMLKNDLGELELSVFDLLGQNQSISQNVAASYIEETKTNVIQRYFMLTFTYKLRSFHS